MRKPVFLQDRRAVEDVAGAAGIAQQHPDFRDAGGDLLAACAMHHGEQVVGPIGQAARTAVAVGDEFQGADLCPEFVDARVVDIPHRHAVGGIADGVMIRHRTDAADDAGIEHASQAGDDLVAGNSELQADRIVRPRQARQAGLGGDHQAPVGGVEFRPGLRFRHAVSSPRNTRVPWGRRTPAGRCSPRSRRWPARCPAASPWPARTTCSTRARGDSCGPLRRRH
jgi:hypothetical protein